MSYGNITKLLRDGRLRQQVEHAVEEQKKLGTLRVGNSGIRSPDSDDVAGSCHRKTYLRTLGIEVERPDDSKLMMFELGYASEDIVVKTLQGSLEPGHVILREADIPINWTTRNGTAVSGRPDVVICKQYSPDPADPLVVQKVINQPVLGIELKSVHSVWSAKKYLFEQTPSLSNLCQAGHYMWKLGIPYRLIYKGYSQLGQGMSWAPRMASMFPAKGEPMSEYLDYNEKGMPLQVKQFEIGYQLELDQHGRLKYKSDLSDKWVSSLITVADIEGYYNYVAEMGERKQLGPRPMTLDAVGNKESYQMCKYCPLQETCDKHETKGFDTWLAEVRKVAIS